MTKKYATKEDAVANTQKDFLTVPEITSRAVKQVRPDLLYRTHMAIHRDANGGARSKKLVKAHKIIAEELIARGFMHHQWDRLDSVFINSK